MILNESDAQALANKVLALSKADSCTVTIGGYESRHIRYAQNMATTNGAPGGIEVRVESHFGKRSGATSGTDFGDDALAVLVAASEKTARLAPENPEFMPPLGPQKYAAGTGFSPVTESATSAMLASAIGPVLREAQAKNLQASGFLRTDVSFSAFATSNGLFAYDRQTGVLHTVTARTPDGTGAGWAGTTHYDFGKFDAAAMGSVAIDKAIRSQKPSRLSPGKYRVILEPSAVSDLIGILVAWEFDQRAADEGRNFATKEGGGSRLGETAFGKNVTIYSDPNDPVTPGGVYSDDGLPAQKTMWIENGVLKNLQCSRYWAQKSKLQPVPGPTMLTMVGGTASAADMLKQTKRGLLITRFWYIREVDPQTVLLTGLTRDGVFLIEDGEIVRPVCNFRFNESPVAMLNKVVALGPSVRTYGEEGPGLPVAAPPLLVDEFTLSSVSDAV
ncbi:MAG TPA: TldD/PmbA family protein [Candidatus Methylacidiphilales bacterium]|nr:TldD/PmbA family protein [Candidatus Methylacidiphilales bacterium]